MLFDRTIARVASAWMRDARVALGASKSKFDRFLTEMGERKVRVPGHDAEVQINTLASSSESADREWVQKEFDKWSNKQTTGTDTSEKLKALQDELVELAVADGASKKDARELVKGLNVGDSEEDVRQVEKNLEELVKKSVAARQKKDEEAAAQKQKKDEEAAAQRQLKDLQAKQDKLIADAVADGVPEYQASQLKKELRVGDTDAALKEVRKKLKPLVNKALQKAQRQQVRDQAEFTALNVDNAREALAEATKTKDPEAIAAAQAHLRDMEEFARRSKMDVFDADSEEFQHSIEEDEAAQDVADAAAEDAARDIMEIKARIEQAQQDGDSDTVARAEADLQRAQKKYWAAADGVAIHAQRITQKELIRNKHLIEVAQSEFEESWKRSQENRGMWLFNAEGKAVLYNPEANDKAYAFMMALLGEQFQERRLPDSDTSSRSLGTEDEDEHRPGEIWQTEDDNWAAKNTKGKIKTFETEPQAQAYANRASARIASRYLRWAAL
jgi:hypothetical protein